MKISLLLCDGYEHVLPHVCIEFEKRTCSLCKKDVCRHCVMEKEENTYYCIACYKEKTIHGLPDSYLKEKEVLIREIKENAYGGAYEHVKKKTNRRASVHAL